MTDYPQWPTYAFGYPQRNGYGYKDQSNIIRSQPEAGPAKERRRFSCVPSEFPVTFIMSDAVLAQFDGFHHYELLDGAKWFEAPLPTGMGSGRQLVKFKGDIGVDADPNRPGKWIVKGVWEVEERPRLSEDEYYAIKERYDHDAVTAQDEFDELGDVLDGDLGDILSM